MIKNNLIWFFAIAFILSGCASIMSGSTQRITIDSEPQGAKVVVAAKRNKEGELVKSYEAGVTPLEIEVSRRKVVIVVSKEGYKTEEVPLQTTMNPWMLGNVVLTSPLSTSIDTSTGAYNEYKPGQYMVTLQSEN